MLLWKALKSFIVSFFLLSGLLQLEPSIRTNQPAFVLVPVFIVIIALMVFEASEETRRWLQDRSINSQVVKRVRMSKAAPYLISSKTTSAEIRVGDIILLDNDV